MNEKKLTPLQAYLTLAGTNIALRLPAAPIQNYAAYIEKWRINDLIKTGKYPTSGFRYVSVLYAAGHIRDGLTGLPTYVARNVTRELTKGIAWSLPTIFNHLIHEDYTKENPSTTKAATTAAVIGINATTNQVFDHLRLYHMGVVQSGRTTTILASAAEFMKEKGVRGFGVGFGATVADSVLFWGSFMAFRETYVKVGNAMGVDQKTSIPAQIATGAAIGASVTAVVMPVEWFRYGTLGDGKLPKNPVSAVAHVATNLYPKYGIRTVYCGAPQAMLQHILSCAISNMALCFQERKH